MQKPDLGCTPASPDETGTHEVVSEYVRDRASSHLESIMAFRTSHRRANLRFYQFADRRIHGAGGQRYLFFVLIELGLHGTCYQRYYLSRGNQQDISLNLGNNDIIP